MIIKNKYIGQCLLIITLLFFPSFVFGEWKKLSTSIKNDDYYVDFDTIKINEGLIYFWYLSNFQDPLSDGSKSTMMYLQGDCNIFRIKPLDASKYSQRFGKGERSIFRITKKWYYPNPKTSLAIVFKKVCRYVD